MNATETDRLDKLERRLFGGDGEGGAIGEINNRLIPVTEFYQQAIGVLRVIKWLGVGFLLTAIIGVAKSTALL